MSGANLSHLKNPLRAGFLSHRRIRGLALAAVVVAGTAAASSILILLAGASPPAALRSLLSGALLSRAGLGETLARTTGLCLTALSAVLAFRSGALNIGIQGQLLMGAAAAAAVGPALSAAPFLARIALLAAAVLAGALTALPAAWLAEKRNVPAVLSTILLNLLAAAAVTWLVRGPLRDPQGDYPQSPQLSEGVRLRPLLAGSRATAAVPGALLCPLALWFLLEKTSVGLALRAVGASPRAARAAGLNDVACRVGSFLGSGALAGLAGGLEVLAITGRLYDPFAAGLGYAGIAAALLGALHPLGAGAAALLLAALAAGGSAMQRDAGVPAALSSIVPALALLILFAVRRGDRGDRVEKAEAVTT